MCVIPIDIAHIVRYNISVKRGKQYESNRNHQHFKKRI